MTGVRTGRNCHIAPSAEVGIHGPDEQTVIGDDATIRAGSVVYGGVVIGNGLTTGHDVLVREDSRLGDDVLIGTKSVLDGSLDIGSNVSIQTGVYLPREVRVGDNVFFGPHAVVTNDPYPVRESSVLVETVIEDHVSVGANATLLPGVTIGKGSFVAAGAVVTSDVPPGTLAVGAPARFEELPPRLTGRNQIA